MKGRPLAFALIACVTMAGCGAATTTEPATVARTTPADELTMNIPDADWMRFEVPEGHVTFSAPGTPVRRVATRETGQTFEYLVAREPFAIMVAVERSAGVLVGDAERVGLDAVAELFSTRAGQTGQGCASADAETITVAGRQARLVVGTHCRDLSDGSLAVAAFVHGSVLVSAIVIGEGVGARNTRALLARTLDTVVLGPPPSWFQPVDTDVAIAHVPGLSLRMPHGVVTETVETEGVVTGRYTSEPIRGMAVVVSVTAPGALSTAEYCTRVRTSGDLELIEERNHLGEPRGYCEVRGRHTSRPELYEIHDIRSVGSAVVEIIWVGPYRPEFIAGADAQLAEVRASMTEP